MKGGRGENSEKKPEERIRSKGTSRRRSCMLAGDKDCTSPGARVLSEAEKD